MAEIGIYGERGNNNIIELYNFQEKQYNNLRVPQTGFNSEIFNEYYEETDPCLWNWNVVAPEVSEPVIIQRSETFEESLAIKPLRIIRSIVYTKN